jgi:hypothetical protein
MMRCLDQCSYLSLTKMEYSALGAQLQASGNSFVTGFKGLLCQI